MTPLRQRMLNDMQLHGLSSKTQEAYARAVRQLAEHYGKSPDQISEEELSDYFLYLKNDRSDGFFSPGQRSRLWQIVAWLSPPSTRTPGNDQRKAAVVKLEPERLCPHCGQPLQRMQTLPPQRPRTVISPRWQPP